MERMDRARLIGGIGWVAAGLAGMLAWVVTGPADPPGLVTWIVVGLVAGGTALRLQPVRPGLGWWGGRIAGAAIGLELLGAVGDRFGLLGGPGAPMVSWGDWAHFRAETAQLVPWSALVQPAAVAATIAEFTLGLLLVLGPWWRWVGKATAGLFAVYFLAMVPGMGFTSVLEFGVPVLIGGALVASARGGRRGAERRAPRGDARPASRGAVVPEAAGSGRLAGP